MIVRAAEPADAEGIATVHVRSWQHAYRGLLPQGFLDGMRIEGRVTGWTERLAGLDEPRSAVSVAIADGAVVGFVHTVPSRDEDADTAAAVGELTSIYLLPDRFGQGLGRDLMHAALATMTDAGFREATLWVLADNDRAIGFYRAAGWSEDGARKDDELAGVTVTEMRFRRQLP